MKQLFLVWCVIGAVTVVAGAPQDSSSPASATFEVATVKPNKSGDLRQFIQRQPGERVTVTNMPLRGLITFAYQLAPFQLIGGPSWIASDRFVMVAKLEGNPEFPPVIVKPDVPGPALKPSRTVAAAVIVASFSVDTACKPTPEVQPERPATIRVGGLAAGVGCCRRSAVKSEMSAWVKGSV